MGRRPSFQSSRRPRRPSWREDIGSMRIEPRAQSGGILPRSRLSKWGSRSFERAPLEASAMAASWGNYSSEAAEEAELAEDGFNAESPENAEDDFNAEPARNAEDLNQCRAHSQ